MSNMSTTVIYHSMSLTVLYLCKAKIKISLISPIRPYLVNLKEKLMDQTKKSHEKH